MENFKETDLQKLARLLFTPAFAYNKSRTNKECILITKKIEKLIEAYYQKRVNKLIKKADDETKYEEDFYDYFVNCFSDKDIKFE